MSLITGMVLVSVQSPASATTAPVITAVGSLASTAGAGVSTLSVDPQAVGDALVVVVKVSSSSADVAALSGGGVTSWKRVVAYTDGSHDQELWLGTVTSAGASTVTVSYSSSVSADDVDLDAQEFAASTGSATTWSSITSHGQTNAASTTFSFPSLSPSGAGQLYVGYAGGGGSLSGGSTSGFTYATTADGNLVTYDTQISANAAPNGTLSPALSTTAIGAVIAVASSGSGAPVPQITSVTPSTGPSAGGTSVTVSGSGLSGATAVHFGSAAATNISVTSSTALDATAPPGTGTVDVTVTTPGGTSSTSSADQFVYQASTTPVITAVGSLASTAGAGVSTLSVDPQAVGDALVVVVHIVASNATVASISSSGITGWSRSEQYLDTPAWSGQPHDTEVWLGKVASVGVTTITVRYTTSVSGNNIDLAAQEFTAGAGSSTSWSTGQAAGQDNSAASLAVDYPTLMPAGSGELYFGYAWVPGTATAGSMPSVTYEVTADSNLVCFDGSVSSSVSPVGSQTATAQSSSVGVLIRVAP